MSKIQETYLEDIKVKNSALHEMISSSPKVYERK